MQTNIQSEKGKNIVPILTIKVLYLWNGK